MGTYNKVVKFKMERRELVRRAKGRGPGPGWISVNPPVLHDGFLANYGAHVATSALVGVVATAVALAMAVALPAGALGLFWTALAIAVALAAGVGLPAHWYGRFLTIRDI